MNNPAAQNNQFDEEMTVLLERVCDVDSHDLNDVMEQIAALEQVQRFLSAALDRIDQV